MRGAPREPSVVGVHISLDLAMATSSLNSSSSISDITGYCVCAEAWAGSNGQSGDTPELIVENSIGTSVNGSRVWDTDLSNGLDSAWVGVIFSAAAGGGDSADQWSVAQGTPSPLVFSKVTYGSIQQVRIRAAVQAPAKAMWQFITVAFYKGGVQTESLTPRRCPQVDTTLVSPPIAAEQILTVTPSNNDNDSVTIAGQVRLVNLATTPPNSDDMFCDVFVDAANCAAG